MTVAGDELRERPAPAPGTTTKLSATLLLIWETARDLVIVALIAGATDVVHPLTQRLGIIAFTAWIVFFQFRVTDPEGRAMVWRQFRFRRLGSMLPWVLLAVIPMVVLTASANASDHGDIGEMMKQVAVLFDNLSKSRLGRLLIAVQVLLAAPFVEESFFRGRIQGRFEQRFGAVTSVLISALLFGLVHMRPERLPVDMLIGSVLGASMILTGSVWAPIILHAAANLTFFQIPFVGQPSELLTLWLPERSLLALAFASTLALVAIGFAAARTRAPANVPAPIGEV